MKLSPANKVATVGVVVVVALLAIVQAVSASGASDTVVNAVGGAAFMVVLFAIAIGLIFVLSGVATRRSEQQAEHQREWEAWQAQRDQAVTERLDDLESGGVIDELDPRVKFRSQKGETIYAAIPCYRLQLKTETTGVTYGGPSVRIKIVKGVYYRAGSYRGTKHKEDVLRQLGAGYLIITNRRLVFVAQDEGGNWVRRWGSVVSWRTEGSELVIEQSSGRPMRFDMEVETVEGIPASYADGDPRVLNRLMEIASGE